MNSTINDHTEPRTPSPCLEIDIFELTQSPKGCLASFDATEEQALALFAMSSANTSLRLEGSDLVAPGSINGPGLRFTGAAGAIGEWEASGRKVHLLAFQKEGGPLARLLGWQGELPTNELAEEARKPG